MRPHNIRQATALDAAAIADIYNDYINNTTITFEEQSVDADEMQQRLEKVQALGLPYLVAIVDERVIGYAYATKWKERSAYRYSVETTVYLDNSVKRQGIGNALYHELLTQLRQLGINSAIGGITLPNAASVALHEKLGMRQVAQFKHIGCKFGKWLDVGYWQINLQPDAAA